MFPPRLLHENLNTDVRPDFNWSAEWAIAKAITGLTNCRSHPQEEMESAK